LALHGDHLLPHVERDFGAFQIHSHFFDEQTGDAHAIDLIHGVKFLTAPDDWRDDLFLFQADDKLSINAADFSDFGNVQIFSRHRSVPLLQPYVFAYVVSVGLVDLLDDIIGNLILRHSHHEPQI
jgi:hypothetical protein